MLTLLAPSPECATNFRSAADFLSWAVIGIEPRSQGAIVLP
jgi:hypothetical protein